MSRLDLCLASHMFSFRVWISFCIYTDSQAETNIWNIVASQGDDIRDPPENVDEGIRHTAVDKRHILFFSFLAFRSEVQHKLVAEKKKKSGSLVIIIKSFTGGNDDICPLVKISKPQRRTVTNPARAFVLKRRQKPLRVRPCGCEEYEAVTETLEDSFGTDSPDDREVVVIVHHYLSR